MTGNIFEIQRYSIHDGPGIRTTVFMKGCPLHCMWCHNPESISPEPLLSFLAEKCIGCGECFRVCPNQAHVMHPQKGHVLDRERCTVCGACVENCYSGALELAGREVTVETVLDEVMRDKPFYNTSGGGMTLSGGEPLMQIDFTEALLSDAKEAGLHCVVDTCGFGEFSLFERILSYTDLFLYDIKETAPEQHVTYTGVSNETILLNLRALHDAGAAIVLRLPIVPGVNDREDHFHGIAQLVKSLPDLQACELMPYHSLGISKLERFGLEPNALKDTRTPEATTVAEWTRTLRDLGVNLKQE